MIVPRLKGGLCNQMFTIAAAYNIADSIGSELAINYSIPHVGGQGSSPLKYKDNFYKNIKSTDVIPKNTFNEPDWSYSSIPAVDDSLLDGYFQSEKHFSTRSEKVKELFVFPDDAIKRVQTVSTSLPKKLLGIHIRLGDYIHPTYASTHLICNRQYYINALKQYDLNDYIIIVCTDDPANYSKFINIDNAILCNGKSELEDLYLLSQCDASILSNSTFSWWGSYLGKQKEKVCAPSKWFGKDGPKNYVDIYRDEWTIIDV
jgi:hypothetical protein